MMYNVRILPRQWSCRRRLLTDLSRRWLHSFRLTTPNTSHSDQLWRNNEASRDVDVIDVSQVKPLYGEHVITTPSTCHIVDALSGGRRQKADASSSVPAVGSEGSSHVNTGCTEHAEAGLK